MIKIELPLFNDMHLHARQGDEVQVAGYSLPYCRHVLLMPNTIPPILNAVEAMHYRDTIARTQLSATLEKDQIRTTIQLVPGTTVPADIRNAHRTGVLAAKLYPRGRTTNSHLGFTQIQELYPLFDVMQEVGLVLCLHGEHPESHLNCTVFDWEAEFVTKIFPLIRDNFPKLRIVLEHITTKTAVEAVQVSRGGVAATITPHHLLGTIDDLLADGLNPSYYCKPILKTPRDQAALQGAVYAVGKKFMLGSDSAPHVIAKKYQECGCAGCFTAPVLPELVCEVFQRIGWLNYQGWADHRARYGAWRFLQLNAAEFYHLPTKETETFSVYGTPVKLPAQVSFTSEQGETYTYALPFAGLEVQWSRPGFTNMFAPAEPPHG